MANEQAQAAIAHSTYDWLSDTENSGKTDILAVIYETETINDTSALELIGAKMEETNSSNEAAIRRNSLQVFETPESINVLLYYMSTIYTERRIEAFASAFTDQLIGVADPATVKI